MAITVKQQPTVYLNSGDTLRLSSRVIQSDVTAQWYLNNNKITSATGFNYTKTNFSSFDTGTYLIKFTQLDYTRTSLNILVGLYNPPVNIPPPINSGVNTGFSGINTGMSNTGTIPKPPEISSGIISGYISGLNQSFVAGQNYTFNYIPINFNILESHILWESNLDDPYIGEKYTFNPKAGGNYWIQTEANLVDGRRVINDANISVNEMVSNYIEIYNPNLNTDPTIKYYWKLDNDFIDSKTGTVLVKNGNVVIDKTSFIFPNRPNGGCVNFGGINDYLSTSIPSITTNPTNLSIECMIKLKQFNQNGAGNASILRLEKSWNSYFAFVQDAWQGASILCYNGTPVSNTNINSVFPLNVWNHLKFVINKQGYYVYVNNTQVGSFIAANAIDNFLNSNLQLKFGQELGFFDEVIIKYN